MFTICHRININPVGGFQEQNKTQSAHSAIMLYYSQIQRCLFWSKTYSVPAILHILPTLVNLQGDDQLNRADSNASVCSTEYGCSYGPVSPHLQLYHSGLLPHMPWAAILSKKDNVSGSNFA
jgi:hypothetical protein